MGIWLWLCRRDFYGDAFLYFPAVLRLLGFSVQASYKFLVAFINLGTVLISYYSFRKMFSDEKIALLGCLAYTLAPYRLMDLYTRASVGEYCAMMVLPLILCGFYMVFLDSRKENWWKHAVLIAFGLTGAIQSHVLTVLLVGIIVILACLILIKRVFRKYVFRSLATAAVLTVLLNLCFIVPFLDFYGEDIMINSPEWSGAPQGSFQAGGIFPIQLFALFQRATGSAWPATAGISTEPAFGIGILMTIGLGLFLYLLCIHGQACRHDRNYIPAILCAIFGCLSLYMATCYFPWDALTALGSGVRKIVLTLQFPWRMLAIATILMAFVLCYSFHIAKKALGHCHNYLVVGSLILLLVSCGWYFYDFSFSGEPYRVYSTAGWTRFSCAPVTICLPEPIPIKSRRTSSMPREYLPWRPTRNRGRPLPAVSAQNRRAHMLTSLYCTTSITDASMQIPPNPFLYAPVKTIWYASSCRRGTLVLSQSALSSHGSGDLRRQFLP